MKLVNDNSNMKYKVLKMWKSKDTPRYRSISCPNLAHINNASKTKLPSC